MFRRISLLAPLFRSSKCPFLPHHHQAAYGWTNLEPFCADRETAGKAGKTSKEKSSFITFVLGGPGSGKGTQCVKIADVFGFTHLSAGDLLRKEITSNREKGTEENRLAYESIIGTEPDVVLFFDCSTEEMMRRVLSRKQGRVDDNAETIKMRLKIFEEFNLPVIKHYLERGLLHTISATGSEEDIFERVRPIFETYKPMFR